MHRPILLTIVLSLLSILAEAGTPNRRAAQERAAQLFGLSTPLVLVETIDSEQPAFYVFNADRKERGFAIVSAEGGLLGYAEHGTFNVDSLPPQLVFWLQCYEEQVELIRSRRAVAHRAAVIRQERQPLVKTRWDQDEPYNKLTPTFVYSGKTYQCAIGCVATAMAQVLRFWAAPVQTTEIPAYTSATLKKAMPALPATTFNYDIMLDNYAYNASGESADEVARLMLYCGQAAEMNYYQSSTAVTTGRYLAQYFGMNPNYMDASRSNYSAADWDELIYQELEAGRPVIYSGSKFTSNSGHTFIVDGYRDGLFHINWGWGGRYDGYYKLTEAEPDGGGLGAGIGKGGYNFSQSAILHIQPEATTAVERALTVTALQAEQTTYSRNNTTENFNVPVTFGIWNYTGGNVSANLGVGVYQDGVLKSVAEAFSFPVSLNNRQGYPQLSRTVSIGEGVSDGNFELKAVWRQSDSDTWKECLGSDVYRIALTLSGNSLTAASPVIGSLQVNSVDLSGPMKTDREVTAKVNITNQGDNHVNAVYVIVDDVPLTGAGVYIDSGETDDVTLRFTIAEAGEKDVRICAAIDGSQQLWSSTLTIAERPSADLRCPSASISPLAETGKVLGTTLKFTASVENTGTIPFDDELSFTLYRLMEDTSYGYEVETKKVEAEIPAGEKREVTVSFEELEVGASYWVSLYYPWKRALARIYQTYTQTIVADPSGIEQPTADKNLGNAVVYDMQGRRVTNTSKRDVYIVNGRKVVRMK